jgi:hypothetical protein
MKNFDYYIGIDVSKLTLDISILYEFEISTKTEYYKIENKEKIIAQFVKKQLGDYLPERLLFCFEDTGIYSFPLASCLHDLKLTYWRVPAIEIKRSKGIRRGKDDKIDSKDIAFYAYTQTHKLKPSSMPAKAIQQLRLLFTEREKVLKSLVLFSRTSENKGFISKEVLNTVTSYNSSIINQLKKTLVKIEKTMLEIIASQENLCQQYKLVKSIPGIGRQTSIYPKLRNRKNSLYLYSNF